MKKVVASALFFLALFTCFAQSIADLDVPPDLKRIFERKQLIVAFTASDQPPMYYTDKDGKFIGFDVDIARSMAKELGVELIINRDAASFNDLILLISSGKVDMAISKLSRTLLRARYVKFSTPYIVFKQGLLFNRLQLAKKTSEDQVRTFIRSYKGTIGVIKASSYVGFARENFPNAEIREYPSWKDVVNALDAGDILAAYRDELEIRKVMDTFPNSGLKFKPMYFSDMVDPIAVAVHYENYQLLNWVNIFLETQGVATTAEKLLVLYKNK